MSKTIRLLALIPLALVAYGVSSFGSSALQGPVHHSSVSVADATPSPGDGIGWD